MNPFNNVPLTEDELQKDCLCYLTYKGKPVKSARLFAGYQHEQQVKRIAAHFEKVEQYYKNVPFNKALLNPEAEVLPFAERDINYFSSYEEAYHQLLGDIMREQVQSTQLVMQPAVKSIFVDGGFSRNELYMQLLAAAFPHQNVSAATVAQATGLGAALAIHAKWNSSSYPSNLITLKKYTSEGVVS
jgi:hypothetical protein